MAVPKTIISKLTIGILVATFFVLILEGITRVLPVESWERDFPNTSYPLFVSGRGDYADYYETNPHFKNSMEFNRFLKQKPSGVERIFILGGSAALGWPGGPNTSYSGYMQRALDDVAPDRFEIINVAAMSYGSHRVLDLLRDVVHYEPDVIVVWSGNNEYIEHNSFSAFARTEEMAQVQRVLRNSMVYRTIRVGLQKTLPAVFAVHRGQDITDPRAQSQVRRGMLGRSKKTDSEVLKNFSNNLQHMARLINDSGATGVLCTVPINLSEWRCSDAPAGIANQGQLASWKKLLTEATNLLDQRRFSDAAERLEELLLLTPDYASGHYLLGYCRQRLGHISQALESFERACDLDPRPTRANRSLQEGIRSTAHANGLKLVDLKKNFIDRSSRLSGLDLFLDYVHPNDNGHRFAASQLVQEILPAIAADLSHTDVITKVVEDQWVQRNRVNQHTNLYTLGMTLQNNNDLAGAESAYLGALKEKPDFAEPAGNLGVIYQKMGKLDLARQYYQFALSLDPDSIHASNYAGLLYTQGQLKQARELAERVLRQGVADIDTIVLLGYIAYAERRFNDAIGFFRQAVDSGVGSSDIMMKIGNSLKMIGDETGAEQAFSRARALP